MDKHSDEKLNTHSFYKFSFNKAYLFPTDNLSKDSFLLDLDILDFPHYTEICSITSFAKHISDLYHEKKYYAILTVLPKLHKFQILPSSIRIIIALTLFILGRIGGALRELFLLIEMELDPNRTERYIQCASSLFEKLNITEQTRANFNDAIDEALNKTPVKKVDKLKLMILEKKQDYIIWH